MVALVEIFICDPRSGTLHWRERPRSAFRTDSICRAWNTRWSGKPAITTDNGDGYLSGALNGKRVYAHRIIYEIATGKQPEIIDHINGNRSDNRICNLRSVSRAENQRNLSVHGRNTSGIPGVSYSRRDHRWRAYINVGGRQASLGMFDTAEEAAAARKEAERRIGFHENHGGRRRDG